MNYQKLYYTIIENHQCKEGVVEKHHILPRCMGGTNDPENLVSVSPRVHYILHLLLYKFVERRYRKQMWFAVWNMSNQGKTKTGSMYQFIREQASKHQKEIQPKVPWNKGRKGYKIDSSWQKGKPKPSSRRPIEYDGVSYPSIQEARKATGKSHYIIVKYGKHILPLFQSNKPKDLSLGPRQIQTDTDT